VDSAYFSAKTLPGLLNIVHQNHIDVKASEGNVKNLVSDIELYVNIFFGWTSWQ
jgi:hypothetical protein